MYSWTFTVRSTAGDRTWGGLRVTYHGPVWTYTGPDQVKNLENPPQVLLCTREFPNKAYGTKPVRPSPGNCVYFYTRPAHTVRPRVFFKVSCLRSCAPVVISIFSPMRTRQSSLSSRFCFHKKKFSGKKNHPTFIPGAENSWPNKVSATLD